MRGHLTLRVANNPPHKLTEGQAIGSISHEFFHSWNVKRIRPHYLEPFDYERADMSDSL